MKAVTSPEETQAAIDAVAEHGSQRKAAKALGVALSTLQSRLKGGTAKGSRDTKPEPIVKGRVHATARTEWPLPPKGQVNRYLFTSVQNNTHLFAAGWENIRALADHYGARIVASTFTYDKASYGVDSVKRGKAAGDDAKGAPWYAPEVEPFICDESVIVAPGLVWCGEMNILPTAVRPLSGLESYTGRKSAIFPHVKFALDSVASGKHEGTKLNYTTGTVTQRNYIAKKEGLKAEFHHGYGGLLVEVDSDGGWFCRQVNADSDGTLYDLTLRAKDGHVTDGHRMEALTWGDIHVGTIPAEVQTMIWGAHGMLDCLRPKYQFMHDVLDWKARSHHDRKDPHKLFKRFVEGRDDVVAEIVKVGLFLAQVSSRPWCRTVVVDSNHDNAMAQWLREADYRADPKNALFFLQAQTRMYEAIHHREADFHLVEWTMRRLMESGEMLGVKFLRPDESFITCPDANGGIENGMHGHLGANGSRGSLHQFAKMGRKSNTGHGHSAGIEGGAYRSGITGDFDQEYNEGPSSWSRSHIGTYENGKRTILTSWGSKWKA